LYWQFVIRKPTFDDAKPMPELASLPDVWYNVRGYQCQPGGICTCPSGPCKRVNFEIYEGTDTNYETVVGSAAKVFSGCLKEAFTDTDNFVMEFPPNALPVQKAALMTTLILTDFMLFENNQRQTGGDF
jgi:hypothetical protein